MATNTLRTRMQLKYDTFSAWINSSFIPLPGEVCIAVIPNGQSAPYDRIVGNPTNSGLSPYAIGVKVGDGIHTFSNLPWIQAIAGDVYAWAKHSSVVNDNTRTDLTNLISSTVQDTDTVYRIEEGTGNNAGKFFLQAKAKGANDNTYTTVSTIDLSSVQNALEFNGIYDASTNKVATESTVNNAVNGLNGSAISTSADGNQYSVLTGITETNGVISKTSEVKLAAIAKTGNVNDLIQTNGDFLLLNCGSSTELIDNLS